MVATRYISLVMVLAVLHHVSAAPHEESVSDNKEQSNIIAKIIGNKAHIEDYPYTGSILVKDFRHGSVWSYNHYGSVIIQNKKWVLTSGFPPSGEKPSDILIRVGSDSAARNGQVSVATDVVIHPKRAGWSYDIALIKLETPLKFGKTVKAIRITRSTPKGGVKAVVSGFGASNYSSDIYPNTKSEKFLREDKCLRSISLKVLPYEECNNYYNNTRYEDNFTNTSFCTTAKTELQPCYADYGSPLVSKKQLIGVFSDAPKCNSIYWPPVYTDVVQFTKWIRDTIKKNSSPAELREIKKDIQYY